LAENCIKGTMSSLYMPIKEITPLPFDVYLAELVYKMEGKIFLHFISK
jgi:hypothetical protein